MFASMSTAGSGVDIEFAPQEPATGYQKLQWEKETLGLFVSSHPLAGLRKYIGKKARLIETLNADDVGHKITVAGIMEQIKPIHTKKGDTMAIVTIEDPTGKMEATLFPRAYAQFKDILEKKDSFLVMAGVLDMRMGLPQLKVEAIKRASLETMVERAKADGLFNEEEAKNWRGTARRHEAEVVEVVTEEGDIVTERIAVPTEEKVVTDAPKPADEKDADRTPGPLAEWIQGGMETESALKALKLKGMSIETESTPAPIPMSAQTSRLIPQDSSISIHTISLPARAPKELLLEIRQIFQTFAGSEKVRLKIGEKLVAVPMTITMSPIVEKKIEEAKKRFEV